MSRLVSASQAAAEQSTALLHFTQVLNLTAVLCAVAVLASRGRARRAAATGWALAMFADLGVIMTLGLFPVTDDGSPTRHAYIVVVVCVLLLIPYLLVRFAVSLGAVGRRAHRFA